MISARLNRSTPSRLMRKIYRTLRPRPLAPVVLMYHRVAKPADDPWGLCISPAHFDAQMAMLRAHRTVLPLDALVACARAGTLRADAVAITFDDGYVDNLEAAAPILAAHHLPATLFLATGPSLREGNYWFEDLAELILNAHGAPDVTVDIGGTAFRIALGPCEPLDENRGTWRGWDPPRTNRETLFIQLWTMIRVLPSPVQQQTIAALAAALGQDLRRPARPMTVREVQAIAAGSFTIGAHTVDHADLSALNDRVAYDQIARGKAEAEAMAGTAVTGFAYPFGLLGARSAALVEQAGYDYACTVQHGYVSSHDLDVYRIPRVQMDDTPSIDAI